MHKVAVRSMSNLMFFLLVHPRSQSRDRPFGCAIPRNPSYGEAVWPWGDLIGTIMLKIILPSLLVLAALSAGPATAQEVPSATPSIEAPVDPALSSQPDQSTSFDADSAIDTGVTSEQSAQIAQIIAAAGVPRVAVDFDVAIGAAIPSSVTLSPLPVEVTSLVPGLAGYLFFVVDDGRIVLVSPNTLRVVLVIYG